MGRVSSRVGQARDDAGLGQWTMNEWMGLELCRLASRYAVATLQNFRTCAWSLAVSPVALTRWGDKLWSSTQWDCGWLQAGLWGTWVPRYPGTSTYLNNMRAPNPGLLRSTAFITALIGAEKVQQSAALDRPTSSFFPPSPSSSAV